MELRSSLFRLEKSTREGSNDVFEHGIRESFFARQSDDSRQDLSKWDDGEAVGRILLGCSDLNANIHCVIYEEREFTILFDCHRGEDGKDLFFEDTFGSFAMFDACIGKSHARDAGGMQTGLEILMEAVVLACTMAAVR